MYKEILLTVFANKFGNLGEMDKLREKYNLAKVAQDEIKNQNSFLLKKLNSLAIPSHEEKLIHHSFASRPEKEPKHGIQAIWITFYKVKDFTEIH